METTVEEKEVKVPGYPEAELKEIPLVNLFPSPTNQRRVYDQAKMDELIGSISTCGIKQPLTVRSFSDGVNFEIVAGERRFRAAKAAGLIAVPCIVHHHLSTPEAQEIQTLENLDREDLLPMEQSEAYRFLLRERFNGDIGMLAATVGKSISHIAQYLKLRDLSPDFQQKLESGWITLGHALLIARLPIEAQKDLYQHFLVSSEHLPVVNFSVKKLSEFIEKNYLLVLKEVAFSKKDATLNPDWQLTCIECPQRTGNDSTLFADIKRKDLCLSPSCFRVKLKNHVERLIANHPDAPKISADYATSKPGVLTKHQYILIKGDPDEEAKEACEFAEDAVVVEGKQHLQGRLFLICHSPECPTHARKHTSGDSMTAASSDHKKAEKEAAKAKKQAREMNLFILRSTLEKFPAKPAAEELRFIATKMFDRFWSDRKKSLLKYLDLAPEKVKTSYGDYLNHDLPILKYLKKQNEKGLYQFLMLLSLFGSIDSDSPNSEIDKLARKLKLNPVALRKQYVAANEKQPKLKGVK